MGEFVRIGRVDDFPKDRGRAVDLEGQRVAVFRTPDGIVAIGDTCRHMGAPLSEGRLEGDVVCCPWHHWRYDVRTGRSNSRTGASVPVYEVRIDGDDVLLRRPESPEE